MELLNAIIDKADKVISGEDAFKLNDTFGFPIDLTREIAQESGIKVDVERFRELLKEQKTRSRKARKNAGADAWISDTTDMSDINATEFVGYTDYNADSEVLAIVRDGERVDLVSEGESAIVVTAKTPFYAESGGQVGDTGYITTENAKISVDNTTKDNSGIFLHSVTVENGALTVGDKVKLSIDSERRESIRRNHTAAHLLQAALREVLGTHVEQAGQLVTDESVRFDFTHFEAMTAKELIEVERLVNRKILEGINVETREMPIDEAKKLGAMALFGEKYGDVVRVVKAGDFSVELCGGTHVDNTSKLGLFKIRQEGSVAAGVRRIEAMTGIGVLRYINNAVTMIGEAASVFKLNDPKKLVAAMTKFVEEMKSKDKEIEALKNKLALSQLDGILSSSVDVNGVSVITSKVQDVQGGQLKDMCNMCLDRNQKAVVVLCGVTGGKGTFACACGKEALALGLNAGKIVKAAAQLTGGNGGGKPDMAMAGAKDVSKIDEALSAVKDIVAESL
jgi:alanyl-tRNA synthetase